MKKIKKLIAVLSIGCVFMGCSKKDTTNYSNQYEKDKATNEAQIIANQGSASKVGGTVAGGVGGAAGGAALGAGIGSVIPGPGTAAGAIIGAISGGIAGAIGGTAAGYKLSNGDMSEYINAKTQFTFNQHVNDETERVTTFVYGTDANEHKYFNPTFKVGEEVSMIIEIKTSLLDKAKKASSRQKSEDLLIPVEISISKSENIEVTYDGGRQKESMRVENDIDGIARFSFFIKNNSQLPNTLKFTFTPSVPGRADVNVTYGLPEYKIVDSSCDIFHIIKFEK